MEFIFICLTYSDTASMISSVEGDIRPRIDAYQQTEGLTMKENECKSARKTDSGKASYAVYNTMADAPSYENPLYGSNLTSESFVLPGTAAEKTQADRAKLEIRELNLDNSYKTI